MKFTVSKQRLDRALASVAGAVRSNHTKEILQCVKIEVSDALQQVTISGTDLENFAMITISGVSVDRPGKFVLQIADLRRLVSTAADEITFDQNGNDINFKTGKFKGRLPTANPDEYPSISATPPDGNKATVSGSALLSMIRRTIGSIDEDSVRFALGGVNLLIIDNQLIAVGTDGRRLAMSTADATDIHVTTDNNSIVNAAGLKLVARALNDSDKVVITTTLDSIYFTFDGGNKNFSCRLIDGRYPNWRQVIPQRDNSTIVPISAGDLLLALKQVSLTADSESKGIDFLFQKGCLTLVGLSARGESEADLTIPFNNEPLKVKLDAEFVKDFLQAIPADEEFSFDVLSSTASVVLTYGNDYTYVVMPMALDKGDVPAPEEAEAA